MSPLNGSLTIEESLRVACQMGRCEAELLAPAIETLSRELMRLDPAAVLPETVKAAVLAGANAGIEDALVSIDWLYVAYRMASDKHHAAEAEKVRL